MKSVCKRVGIVLAFILGLAIIAPVEKTFANPNQMISEECLQNPEQCQKDATAVENNNETAAVGLTAWDYVKMLFALIFVLVLLVWVLKFINKKSLNFQQNNIVRNIGGLSLGSQKSVQILQIGHKLYIVGVGENVELIKEISEREEVEKLLDFYNEKQKLSTSSPYILELFKKNKGQKDAQENYSNSDFGDLLNKQLSDIQEARRNELEKWKEKEHDK
ncbi:MAG: flagellar protein [Lysinibacillus sp.]|nr:flagellar protein [Lysinibacillus sp.]